MNNVSFFQSALSKVRYGKQIDPARDWIALLTLSLIIFAGILVWNAWAFGTVVNGGVIGNASVKVAPAFSSDSLTAIHTVFDNRALEETNYVTGVYRFADPSQ